jgi:hypothetical protein
VIDDVDTLARDPAMVQMAAEPATGQGRGTARLNRLLFDSLNRAARINLISKQILTSLKCKIRRSLYVFRSYLKVISNISLDRISSSTTFLCSLSGYKTSAEVR